MAKLGEIDCSKVLQRGYVEEPPRGSGIYWVRIREDRFDPETHGPSPILHIGKGASHTWGLTWRIGEFFGASLGFGSPHSSGKRFAAYREQLGLTVADLVIRWEQTGPKRAPGRERAAFDEFERSIKESEDDLLALRWKLYGMVPGVGRSYPLLSLRRG